MNHDERQMIDGLFGRLKDAERTAPPRDAEAEGFIRDQVASQPGAPYYMAQTIIVQEQALEAAQARIQELESQGQRSGGGGLLGSLFGGGSQERRPQQTGRPMGAPAGYARSAAPGEAAPGSPWGSRGAAGNQPSRGGGFLAGAAQTAVGVAGGMMLGSMLGGMFGGGDEAQAGEVDPGAGEAGGEDFAAGDAGGMDDGGFGDFDL